MQKLDITKEDIGGEVLSILTKGMYPDPRDAIREYVQNGIDARARNMAVKIRQDSIVVEDDGSGMNAKTLRNAIRVGISDKNPRRKVGFMGIGIYSSFHLCDYLAIYSKSSLEKPNRVRLDFKGMRELLEDQKERRMNDKSGSNNFIDLQTLLEKFISFVSLENSDFPSNGTRVEMTGIEENFAEMLSTFGDVADYLRDVVPLHFNFEKFKWGELIEKRIDKVCTKHFAKFEKVNLKLQVNNDMDQLYKPYEDINFSDSKPIKPMFREIKKDGIFIGASWACLNSSRHTISDKALRGFVIKKQGFTIGKRENVVKFFGRPTYFNRYIGEIIVVNSKILPNASRSDFEFSPLRTYFYEQLAITASFYNNKANLYQEYSLGDEQIDEATELLKNISNSINLYSKDNTPLIDAIVTIRAQKEKIQGRIDRESFYEERVSDAKKIIKVCNELESTIQNIINKNTSRRRRVFTEIEKKEPEKIEQELSTIPVEGKKSKTFKNLLEIFQDLDITLTEDLTKIIWLLDERCVHVAANSLEEYEILLKELRDEIERLIE